MNPNAACSDQGHRPRWLYPAVAAVLISAFLIQALLSMTYASLVFDEPVYIAAGESYWVTRDDYINVEHPPMLKMLITLPLLPLRLTVPTNDRTFRQDNEFGFARVFLSKQGDHVARIIFRSRLPIVFIGVLLALFVRRWAAELWGAEAGLAALLLFVFEPNILANSTLATLDLGLAAFVFISMFSVWKWLRTGRAGYGILAGVTLGFSLLSKEAALAFLPIFLAYFILDDFVARRNQLPRYVHPLKGFLRVTAGAAVVLIVFYAVAFHWRPLLHAEGQHRTVDELFARIPAVIRGPLEHQIVALGQSMWVPDVAKYAQGVFDQRRHLNVGHASFVMGRRSMRGSWYDYLLAFLIKTPLPILLLVIVRFILLPAIPMDAGEYMIVLPIVLFMGVASFESVSAYLGLRNILPLYPFLFVWLSRLVTLLLVGGVRNVGTQPGN